MNSLPEIITRETEKHGVISFARFMELALYCPVCGYYEKERDTVGRRGDFFTSVSVGSLFGELLAFQFAEWLEPVRAAGRHAPGAISDVARARCEVRIVEAGAHQGRLARDILSWLRERRPELFQRLEYVIAEPSSRRRGWQKEMLREFGDRVRWVEKLEELAEEGIRGIIFSNELLDAMPVHRLGWDAANRVWFEWGVASKNGQFVWTRIQYPASSIRHPSLPDTLPGILADGFTVECCPAAEEWWRAAAGMLRLGKLLTVDYGLVAEEMFMPQRKEGTVRAYYRHHPGQDVLANPGEQDLTAHVNFTSIQSAGEAAGLRTDSFTAQAIFLTGIAERVWRQQTDFGEWTPARTRQFQTLIHPEHLGVRFRVLVQSR